MSYKQSNSLFFLTAFSLWGSQGGGWNLSRLHTGKGRVQPWMSCQLNVGPKRAFEDLVPQYTVCDSYIIVFCWRFFVCTFFLHYLQSSSRVETLWDMFCKPGLVHINDSTFYYFIIMCWFWPFVITQSAGGGHRPHLILFFLGDSRQPLHHKWKH